MSPFVPNLQAKSMPSHNLWTVRPEMNLCILYKISIVPKGTFYQHILTLIPAWICNYALRKVWVEITNPFPNLNGATFNWSLGMDK